MRCKSIRGKTIAERLWEKVERRPSGCWEFTGSVSMGYGSIGLEGGKRTIGAHRLAWMLHHQADPGDLFICHTCDNKLCCNPHHLYAGTVADNARDAVERGLNKGNTNAGEDSHSARVTQAQVDEIRRLRREGVLLTVIADQFGLTKSGVHAIVQGRTWKKSHELQNAGLVS